MNPIEKPQRCQYRSSSGLQCRYSSRGNASGLCARHEAVETKRSSAGLTALLNIADNFHSAAGISRSLAELFTLLAEDRVSPRRAAVLAYICSLLLRSLPAMDRELNASVPKKAPPVIIWDLAEPSREAVKQAT